MKFTEFFDNFFQPRFEANWGSNFRDELNELGNEGFEENNEFSNHSDIFGNHGDIFGNHGNIFAMMDQMMRDFHPENFSSNPQLDLQPRMSLRDQVLKQPQGGSSESSVLPDNNFSPALPDNNHFNSILKNFFGGSLYSPVMESPIIKDDTDLDCQVNEHGLDSILNRDVPQPDNGFKSYFRGTFESRSTIRRADGSSEHRTTKRDHQGNETTTIVTETPSGEKTTQVITSDGQVNHDNRSILLKPKNENLGLFLNISELITDLFK